MENAPAAWHAEHKRFEKLLDFLDREMVVFEREGEPDYALMRDVVHYLCGYGRYHHARENVAFRRLVELDAGLELPVNRLLQEHRVIGVAGEALLARLDDVLNDAVILRETVEAEAAQFLLCYRHHLATEERAIVPRAAALLTPADWAAVAAAAPAERDPLFGTHAHSQYQALRARIDLEGPFGVSSAG